MLASENTSHSVLPGKVDLSEPIFLAEKNVILLPDTEQYREFLPDHYKTITTTSDKGRQVPLHACKNSVWLNQVLYNVGFEVPAPILYDDYDWNKTKPFETQRLTAGMTTTRLRAFVLNGLGTGKTLSMLYTLDWLKKHNYINKALVIAPLSTIRSVWYNEARKWMPHLRATVLHHGDRRKRVDMLWTEGWDIAITNHHGIKVLKNDLLELGFDAIVIDESAVFRNTGSDLWKAAREITADAQFVWELTGSPTPNGPWDAYAQVKLLFPNALTKSFKRFRDQVAYEFTPGSWLPKPGANEIVFQAMQPAVRFTLDQVTELPPWHEITRTVEDSPAQVTMAKDLRRDMLAMHDQGLVTVANAGVLVGKLMQVHSGMVYTKDKAAIDLHAKDRIAAAKEIIEAAEGKVIVFVAFRPLTEMLKVGLGLKFFDPATGKPGEAAVVHGGTKERERTAIFANFQDKHSGLRVIVAHPACMSHGLTLTEADTIIWYGPTTNREHYEQANGRIRRPGQHRAQNCYHFTSSSFENKLYANLKRKGNMQAALLQLFQERLI